MKQALTTLIIIINIGKKCTFFSGFFLLCCCLAGCMDGVKVSKEEEKKNQKSTIYNPRDYDNNDDD